MVNVSRILKPDYRCVCSEVMQWRLFSQWDPIKFWGVISYSVPHLSTGIFILKKKIEKVVLGWLWVQEPDRPSDQLTVQGQIRAGKGKTKTVCSFWQYSESHQLSLIPTPTSFIISTGLAPFRSVTDHLWRWANSSGGQHATATTYQLVLSSRP